MGVPLARLRLHENARAGARAIGACALLVAEILALDLVYDVRRVAAEVTPLWLGVNELVKHGLYAGLYAMAALALLLWPQRRHAAAIWRAAARPHAWLVFAAANLALFALLMAAAAAARGGAPLAWPAFAALVAGALAMIGAAALSAAPARFWIAFVTSQSRAIALAALAGAMIALAALASQNSWSLLSGATLQLSHALLALVEPRVEIDVAQRLLGVGGFRVIIDSYCSGYEGVGLVVSALGLYLFLFRRRLRFPDVLILLPIGAAAIWLLNGVRIAALVAIGAHVSPSLALTGFHSQAGWLLFVAVTAALMALAQAGFRAGAAPAARNRAIILAVALLAPFAALMAARMAGALAGGAPWVSAAAILAPAAALWLVRGSLRNAASWPRADAVMIGLAVGAVWIATEPAQPAGALGSWLAEQPPGAAGLWLALRIFGFALIVPIAEELAFRGYLHRALTRRRFETAPPAAFSWTAFAVTSLLFGLMHERWLAGALAGAAYALALYRGGSLAAPITAHVASNGLIAAYAVLTGAWALL